MLGFGGPLTVISRANSEKSICAQARKILKAQLFRIHSPSDYFIIPNSEIIVPPYRYHHGAFIKSLGGIEFQLKHRELIKLAIAHESEDKFVVSTAVKYLCTVITKNVVVLPFAVLDSRIYEILRRE